MSERAHVVLPLDVLDGIWPTGVTLRTRRERTTEGWIDALEREVDRGLLYRVGDGTEESPFRWSERVRGAFTLAPTYRSIDDPEGGAWRLLMRLDMRDAR